MQKLNTKEIKTLESYISLIESLRPHYNRPLWFRGCGKLKYELKPTLYRHIGSTNIDDYIDLEKLLLSRFQQRSIPFHNRSINDSWDWLFLMQHYGVPTRLLDWSESPLIALFFAVILSQHKLGVRGKPVFNSDTSIWILDPIQWNKKAIDLKKYSGSILTTDDLNASSYKPVADINTMKEFPIAIYGSHNSQRIVAQRGVFVCFGKDTRSMEIIYQKESFPVDCLQKLVIKKGKLPGIYESLQRHGLTDSVVFPDLDGLAREIKREYNFEV